MVPQEGNSRQITEMDFNGAGPPSGVGQPGPTDLLGGFGRLEQNPAPSMPMEHFMAASTGPWAGFNLTDAQRSQMTSRGAPNPRLQASNSGMMNYRSQPVLSDCDTSVHGGVTHSDSGFYSTSRLSIGQQSTYDDGTNDTQSLAGQLRDFNIPNLGHDLSPGTEAGPHPPPLWGMSASQSGMSPPAPRTASKIHCPHPDCDHESKTKSEHNKHVARHTRPHRCKVPGCNHISGFSTSNDLDRHTRSRHPEIMSSGNSFKCREGSCASKKKIWPRADNFRSHLKRVHKKTFNREDELEHYLVKPEEPILLAGLAQTPDFPPFPGGMGGGVAITPSMLQLRPERMEHGYPSDGRSPHLGDNMGYTYMNTFNFNDSQGLELSPRTEMPPPSRLGLGSLPELEEGRELADDASLVESTHGGPWEPCAQQESASYPAVTSRMDIQAEEDTTAGVEEGASCMDVDEQDSETDDSSEEESVSETEPDQVMVTEVPSNKEKSTYSAPLPNTPCVSSRIETSALQVEEQATSRESSLPEPTPEQQEESESESEGAATPSTGDSQGQPASGQLLKEAGSRSTESGSTAAAPALKALLMDKFKLDDEDAVMEMVRQMEDKGILDKIVGKLGYEKTKPSTGRSSRKGPNGQPIAEIPPQKCAKCGKEFKRPCELKKHQKRHDKPYGCTRCNQRFGSKNDWKRHETGQHTQLDVWMCGEKLSSIASKHAAAPICQRVYHGRETFKTHLQEDHKLSVTHALDTKFETSKVGKDGDARFWCGFCAKLVDAAELNSTSGGVMNTGAPLEDAARGQRRPDRFDHIDDHYCGRNGFKHAEPREWQEPDTVVQPFSAADMARFKAAADKDKERRGLGRADLNTKWFCCQCRNYWDLGMSTCMDSNCGHFHCRDCDELQLPPDMPDGGR